MSLQSIMRKRANEELMRVVKDGHKEAMTGLYDWTERRIHQLSGWHTCATWLAEDDEIPVMASRGRIWLRALLAHLQGREYIIDELDSQLAWRDAA